MGRDGERLRQAFWACLEVAQAHRQGRGPGRRRGHPWAYGWDLYLALLLFRAYLRATYRETVAIYQGLFPDHPCPSLKVPAPVRQGGKGGGAEGPPAGAQGEAPAPLAQGGDTASYGQHGAGPPQQGAAAQVAAGV
ncbi:MAG: hypothetical protein RQ985_06360 [Dehalococcoidia bacterium]|nr:hypothetical protein [Dehalococcoidia bacterium]